MLYSELSSKEFPMIDKSKKKSKKIMEKLQQLLQLQALLRAKKVINDDWDDEDYEELLSRAELMEEALKNYMYQFGLSIYQNKQGRYYFKQYTDEGDLRPRGELDDYHFSPRTREANFVEKLLERVPEEKVMLNTTIESAVSDLYERDPKMAEVFDELLGQEMTKCRYMLDDVRQQDANVATDEKSLQQTDENAVEKDLPAAEKIAADEAEKAPLPDNENQMPEAEALQPAAEKVSEAELSEIDNLAAIDDNGDNLNLDDIIDELPTAEEAPVPDNLEETMQHGYECGAKSAGRARPRHRRNPRPQTPTLEQIMANDNQNNR